MQSSKKVSYPSPQAAHWDAQLYDGRHGYVWASAVALVELLAPQRGERVLDLGCGTGHLTARIADIGAHVIGIDNAESMIAQARSNYPDIQFEVADALSLTYRENFDAVFSNAALHWIRPPEKVAECIWNALRPGGRLVAEFGGKGNVQSIVEAIIRALGEVNVPITNKTNPWYFPIVGEYRTLLEVQGFAVTHATLFDRPTPLEGGQRGLRVWIEMFGSSFLGGLSDDLRAAIVCRIEDILRPHLYHDGIWVADYKRIRVVALRDRNYP